MCHIIYMNFNEYQKSAVETAIYPSEHSIIYPALGLAGEAGECAEKVKKALRDDSGVFSNEKKKEIVKELGDVLWYVANIVNDLGEIEGKKVTLEEVAKQNLIKLESRKARGVISGSGDNR